MKKKTVRKKKSNKNTSRTKYLIIGFIIAIILFIAAASYQTLKNAHVLGISSFLAKNSSESSVNEDANKTPEPQENHTPEPKDIRTPEPREIHTPEPKLIKTELNLITNKLPSKKVEIQIENHQSSINVAAQGTHIELKTEDDGSISYKAKQADGTEIQLETHALENINDALKEDDIEIGTTSAKGFSITNKFTKAETEFPVTVNLASKMLSVGTPLGQKDLNVLPNQAVKNAFDQKIIDRVSDKSITGNGDTQLQLVQLRLFENKPVFEVQGIDDKKLFGFLPVAIQKTTLISAETGQLVKTNEDIANKLLDIFSLQ